MLLGVEKGCYPLRCCSFIIRKGGLVFFVLDMVANHANSRFVLFWFCLGSRSTLQAIQSSFCVKQS